MPPNLWQVRRCRRRSRFICSIVSVSGVDFRCREGDFSPFSAVCSSVYSCSISCVSVRSCACVELFKTARVDNISVACPHLIHLNRPVPRPVFRHGWRGVFFLLAVYRAAAASRHLSHLVAIVPSWRFALPIASGLSYIVFASPRRYIVAVRLIISSSHRLSSRSFDTAGGERSVLAACGGVFVSAWCGIIPPRYRRGCRAAYVAVGVLIIPSRSSCRIAWCDRLLEKRRRLVRPSSSWRCARHFASLGCLPNCPSFSYLVRFSYVSAFATAIGLASPLVSNWRGVGRGGILPSCLICLFGGCECLRRW